MTNPEKKCWTVSLEEDENGELLLPFPVDLLSQMGWAEGTEIWWSVTEDGNIIIKDTKDE
jgi:hypothetical protein